MKKIIFLFLVIVNSLMSFGCEDFDYNLTLQDAKEPIQSYYFNNPDFQKQIFPIIDNIQISKIYEVHGGRAYYGFGKDYTTSKAVISISILNGYECGECIEREIKKENEELDLVENKIYRGTKYKVLLSKNFKTILIILENGVINYLKIHSNELTIEELNDFYRSINILKIISCFNDKIFNRINAHLKDIDVIIKYYHFLKNHNLDQAYQLSDKKVSYDIFKNSYSNLKDIHVNSFKVLTDYRYLFYIYVKNETELFETYEVTIEISNNKILKSISQKITM
ncbi:MAG: hypothetical protein A2086_16000 [Spirochaetes bacterium GWD1_27_9]|nr:MAG: hypothetical protein A2Z98_11385 [Spirochaetes bacterium GWB1_27_13]OHD22542.1 MAG: hypothetical protein A2Y34_11025 [Spirochaetes bacterium GWC1_27_15]OHD36218.1 MAG: hypothetical protein A2086_16000 [Spirochaetes bacterium GWD1_27_9]